MIPHRLHVVKLYVAVCLGAVVFIVNLYYHYFILNANIGVRQFLHIIRIYANDTP